MVEESGIQDDIFVNGRFLSRPMTGVERFATMTLRYIDADPEQARHYTILAPRGVARPAWLINMGFRNTGTFQGHLWEQVDLYRAAAKGRLINLCNSGPVWQKRNFTVIHDAWVFRFPQHFRWIYAAGHRLLGRLLARRSRIGTVSEFSRRELSDVFDIPAEDITVIPNATDHLDEITPDETILETLGLYHRGYLLMVGSFAPNKNMKRAIEAFGKAAEADELLVIVGGAVKSFTASDIDTVPGNVILAGRVNDAMLLALYDHCTAMVFPSLYEGFGIPPLEAMHSGRPVIASDIPAVREVCADAAQYFDPYDVDDISRCMKKALREPETRERCAAAAVQRTKQFRWEQSSKILQRTIEML